MPDTPGDEPEIRVADNPDEGRYEVLVDGALGGFAAYRLAPGRIVFTHTEVDDAYEGHGVGSTLVRGALDDARARKLLVTPICPFVRAYIERHTEYQDLVAPKA
jgi:predicted GNAT family acetyltransferase